MQKRFSDKDFVFKTMKYSVRIGTDTSYESLFQASKSVFQCMQYSINRCVEWRSYSKRYHHSHGIYPSIKEETGSNSIDMLIYHELSDYDFPLSAGCRSAAIRRAIQLFDIAQSKGILPSMKKTPFILIPEICINRLYYNGPSMDNYSKSSPNRYELECRIFSEKHKTANNLTSNVILGIQARQGSEEKKILDLISKGLYSLCKSELRFEKKHNQKGKWFLYLGYKYLRLHQVANTSPKVLGVFLGEQSPIYASSIDTNDKFIIDGDEVLSFVQRIQSSIHSRSRQALYCGEGRIGHGYQKRLQPVHALAQRLRNYKLTTNHRYSRAIVDFANNNQFTDIVIQRTTVNKTEYKSYFREWPYSDLLVKIENKAREKGINVHYSKDSDIFIRCCNCKNTDPNNIDRGGTNRFICTKCGAVYSPDWNAAQNLSMTSLS